MGQAFVEDAGDGVIEVAATRRQRQSLLHGTVDLIILGPIPVPLTGDGPQFLLHFFRWPIHSCVILDHRRDIGDGSPKRTILGLGGKGQDILGNLLLLARC